MRYGPFNNSPVFQTQLFSVFHALLAAVVRVYLCIIQYYVFLRAPRPIVRGHYFLACRPGSRFNPPPRTQGRGEPLALRKRI